MTFEHLGDVVDDRISAALIEMRVEMRRIGSQHDCAALRHHAHALQPHRVAADEMEAETGRDLFIAVMEAHAAGEDAADHADNVVDRERMAEGVMAHRPAGRESHLAILDVECGVRKEIEPTGMVVMHMGDDHILDLAGSMPIAFSPSTGERSNSRFRSRACSAPKPVSTT